MKKASNINKSKKNKNKKQVVDDRFNFDQDYFLGLSDSENNKKHKKNQNDKKSKREKNNTYNATNKQKGNNSKNKRSSSNTKKISNKEADILRQKETLSKNIATGKIKNKQLVQNEKKKIRRQKILKFILLGFIIIGILIFLFISPVFNITEIEVKGNNKVSSDRIESVSEIKKYKNIFLFRKSNANSKILNAEPYIESAKILRNFPNKITIEVTERTPALQIKLDDSTYVYVDNQGYILEYAKDKLDVPVITSAKTDFTTLRAEDSTSRLCEDDLNSLGNILKIISMMKDYELYSYIDGFDIGDSDDIKLKLNKEQQNKIVYFGDCSDLNTRVLYLIEILKDTKGEKGQIFINGDLNEDYIYFREDV